MSIMKVNRNAIIVINTIGYIGIGYNGIWYFGIEYIVI